MFRHKEFAASEPAPNPGEPVEPTRPDFPHIRSVSGGGFHDDRGAEWTREPEIWDAPEPAAAAEPKASFMNRVRGVISTGFDKFEKFREGIGERTIKLGHLATQAVMDPKQSLENFKFYTDQSRARRIGKAAVLFGGAAVVVLGNAYAASRGYSFGSGGHHANTASDLFGSAAKPASHAPHIAETLTPAPPKSTSHIDAVREHAHAARNHAPEMMTVEPGDNPTVIAEHQTHISELNAIHTSPKKLAKLYEYRDRFIRLNPGLKPHFMQIGSKVKLPSLR